MRPALAASSGVYGGPSRLGAAVRPVARRPRAAAAAWPAPRPACARPRAAAPFSTAAPEAGFENPDEPPAFRKLETALSAAQPCFAAHGAAVEILSSPTVFHERLLEMIKRANKRILISSLYIGTEESSLVDAVRTALQANHGLRATFVLDYNRATRVGRGQDPATTVHMLLPLLKEFGDKVDIWLYRSPKLKGALERIVPPRYNEGWGTWHAKYYAVDDEVILSGANLAASYFTNRQDRYIHIGEHPSLLSYLSSITRLVSDYAYKVVYRPRAGTLGPNDVALAPGEEAAALWHQRSLAPRGWAAHANATLTAFQQAWRASNGVRARDARGRGADTWFWPVIQAGVLGIREEERALADVFRAVGAAGAGAVEVDLTSGYFGLYKKYKQAVIDSPAAVNVVAASPKANGFYGSKGPSRLIPEGYTLLESRFHAAAAARGRLRSPANPHGVRLQEWERAGWTYHAKGIWVSPPEQDPFFTFIGSSNLSTRSLNLDAELSLLLSTSNASLRQALGAEVRALREHAHDVGAETWRLDERRVSLAARLLVLLGVEGML